MWKFDNGILLKACLVIVGTFGHASMDLPQRAQFFYDNSGMLQAYY